MDWTAEPFWQWWRSMIPKPEPEPDPAAMAELQHIARTLYTQFRERGVNWGLMKSRIRVTLGAANNA